MSKIAFLLYDSRSGSTFFAAALNRYRGVCVAPESAFVSRVVEYTGNVNNKYDLDALIQYLLREIQFRDWGLEPDEMATAFAAHHYPISRSDIINTISELYFNAKNPDATAWIIKHAPFGHLGLLQKMIPGFKTISIIRDGRAVFASKREAMLLTGRKMETNLLKAATTWKTKVMFSVPLEIPHIQVKYEDLVDHTDAECMKVISFLGVTGNGTVVVKTMEDFSSGIGEKHQHLHHHVGTSPRVDFAEKWKKKLFPAEVYLFEKLAGDALISNDYPLYEIKTKHRFSFYFSVMFQFVKMVVHYVFTRFSNQYGRLIHKDKSVLENIRSKMIRWNWIKINKGA
jgi:hypothetical protein